MKKDTYHTTNRNEATSRGVGRQADSALTRRPDVGRRGPDPLDYQHRYRSLADFARLLGLRFNLPRTRQAYYRQMRLIADHFQSDPTDVSEEQLLDYILHVKKRKLWKPKTIRQAAAAARMFYVGLLGHESWTVFSQIRARDQEQLPAVMTRVEVVALLRRPAHAGGASPVPHMAAPPRHRPESGALTCAACAPTLMRMTTQLTLRPTYCGFSRSPGRAPAASCPPATREGVFVALYTVTLALRHLDPPKRPTVIYKRTPSTPSRNATRTARTARIQTQIA